MTIEQSMGEGKVEIWDIRVQSATDIIRTRSSLGVDPDIRSTTGAPVFAHIERQVEIWDTKSAVCQQSSERSVVLESVILLAAANGEPLLAIFKDTGVEIWDVNPLSSTSTLH
ncbi:hypothetical protein CEK25_012311 [Fusarium fujikuroi]|nr:hypothetical protein CEK25_012311 [Fusarium fujikuroi]